MKESARALTVTYLVKSTLGSLNGGDKEADNLSSIKKFSHGNLEYPYGSSQWVRRALRDQLSNLGWVLSEGQTAEIKKGAATTLQDPGKFIDDDLFGFMGTEKGKTANKRTSPLRVSPLVSLSSYRGDLDFGTNYMSVDAGGDPNIFETEIHSSFYRGTVLIELDRVGCGDGFKKDLAGEDRASRVKALLDSLKNLWSSGRQTRFLADITPKFAAASILSVKNPIFLEVINIRDNDIALKDIALEPLLATIDDYKEVIIKNVFGAREGFFGVVPDGTLPLGQAFEEMKNWVDSFFSD
jgi:CRISPR-associated protein Cst2